MSNEQEKQKHKPQRRDLIAEYYERKAAESGEATAASPTVEGGNEFVEAARRRLAREGAARGALPAGEPSASDPAGETGYQLLDLDGMRRRLAQDRARAPKRPGRQRMRYDRERRR